MLCGASRVLINPEKGHMLAGYGPHPNAGVHDDLAVTALYLSDGAQAAVLLNFDLIAIHGALNRRIRLAAACAAKIPAVSVFLAVTHTHSGPEVRSQHDHMTRGTGWRKEYNDRLIRWAAQAAAEARAAAEECTLHYNFAMAAECMNRRFVLPDRRHLYIPTHKQLAGHSDQYVDRELGILAFRRKGALNRYKALLTNYTAHPLCVGVASSLVTADYQGALRRTVEDTFAGCLCLSTTGAAGDQHPLLPESGFAEAQRMGAALGSLAVARSYDAVHVTYDTRLRLARRDITLWAKDQATRDLLPESCNRRRHPTDPRLGSTIRTSVALLGIGPVLLAGVPGEMVSELGAMIKWSSPFLKTFVLFQATGAINYVVTRNQYLWGGYEPTSSELAAGEGERVVAKVVETAQALVARLPLRFPTVDN